MSQVYQSVCPHCNVCKMSVAEECMNLGSINAFDKTNGA